MAIFEDHEDHHGQAPAQIEKELGDDDSDTGDASQKPLATPSEQRIAQTAKFKSWVTQRAEKIGKEDVKTSIASTADEALSIRNLIAKQETTAIITDPREYQLELFERAKTQNTIAVLDTGSGKTLIAVLLLRHVIDQELEDRMAGRAHRIAFFLVHSVTLVFQQFAVLECNLDHKIERICGAMRPELWSRGIWESHYEKNMVVVCTADVLYHALMHGFIKIEQINLLIFDEAHHAKKDHSYAKIIKDFYLSQIDGYKRPKIFGMTASPVDAKEDVVHAARELETLLHSQITTTADLALLRKIISRPQEEIAFHARLPAPFESAWYQMLASHFAKLELFRRLFKCSKDISSQLGRWCSDTYWSFAFAEEAARKLEMKHERAFQSAKDAKPVAVLDAEIATLRQAASLVAKHDFGSPKATLDDLSSKVLKLHALLEQYFDQPSDSRCIVFVERRYTARLLHQVFMHIASRELRPGVLVGVRGTDGDLNYTFRQQFMTLAKFRRGDLNCLFATSVAEEGLDIPDCNLIIRFDLYQTMIQYVQSRGRARHRNSRYIHMVEEGNNTQQMRVIEVRRAEHIMRRFCQALPEDRMLLGNDHDLDSILNNYGSCRTYTEESTGATLTYGSSLAVLAHFVAALPQTEESIAEPHYVMSVEGSRYVCEVILPGNSPLLSAIGLPASRKSLAKRSAAFEACIQLRKSKHLNEHFLPIYTKHLPAMRNALLALNLKTTNMYPMLLKPTSWQKLAGSIPSELFVVLIEFAGPLEREHRSIVLLSRFKLPNVPQFPLFLNSGKAVEIVCTSLQSCIPVTLEQLEHIMSFTLRVFKDIFNKTYERNLANIPYWLAPTTSNASAAKVVDKLHELLDWDTLRTIHETDEIQWKPDMPLTELEGKFLVDKWDGGRRFFSVNVEPDMKPLDPVPQDAVKFRYNNNILDYTVSLYKAARARATWDVNQPVIRAEKVLHRRNMLASPEAKEQNLRATCYLCPEPLRISALPAPVATSCLLFPAIIHRIDSYLIALEACNLIGVEVDPALALEAITKDSDNTEDNSGERINFQRGMGNNYERLEFMGDCFLKMATSIALFGQNPDNDEFEFHVKRMCLICNQNLFNTALKLELYKYIRSMAFSRRTWYPEGIKLLEGKGSQKNKEETVKHSLGDKTIADVCEALIGAAFITHNDSRSHRSRNWDNAVKAVTALVCSPDHLMNEWADYLRSYQTPAYVSQEATASQWDLARKIENEHPYHFRHPRLLRSAFIHPSIPFIWEKIPSYQRLEFLGDSLLDMACITHLFYLYPDKDPQWLTEHKMAMVSNKFLGALCVKIGFHRHLRYYSSVMGHQIREYVSELEEAEKDSNGAKDYWTAVKAPPKCLPDIVEAYIGALFVDSDFDYTEVQRFFDMHIRVFFEDMAIYDTFANNHPTTQLHTLLSSQFTCQAYRIMAAELPSLPDRITGATTEAAQGVIAAVIVHDTIVAEGRAASGKNAKVKASAAALDALKGLPRFEFVRRYGCNCSQSNTSESANGSG